MSAQVTIYNAGGNCSICRDELNNGKTLTVTSCGHQFHRDCANSWYGQQRRMGAVFLRCGFCNQRIDEPPQTLWERIRPIALGAGAYLCVSLMEVGALDT